MPMGFTMVFLELIMDLVVFSLNYFMTKWNSLFNDKCHICFILTHRQDECYHIAIRVPSGELYYNNNS